MDNIDNIGDVDDLQTHVIFFYKTESKVNLDSINEEAMKQSVLEFQQPNQAMFLLGGEVTIRGGRKHESIGLVMLLEKKELWTELILQVAKMSDNEIMRNPNLPADDFHSWLLYGFDNKEEVIGLIQSTYEIWKRRIDSVKDKLTPKFIDSGDKEGRAPKKVSDPRVK